MSKPQCTDCGAFSSEKNGRTCVNGHFLCMECISDIHAEGVGSFNLSRPDKGCPKCGASWDRSKPYWRYRPYNRRNE